MYTGRSTSPASRLSITDDDRDARTSRHHEKDDPVAGHRHVGDGDERHQSYDGLSRPHDEPDQQKEGDDENVPLTLRQDGVCRDERDFLANPETLASRRSHGSE